MTYKEFCRQLGKAGLNIREFAELVKMNQKSVTNCAKRGEIPSHLAVISTLLGEMGERKIDFRAVLAGIEITPKKPRGGAALGRFGGSKQTDLDLESKLVETVNTTN
ncbi:XRE family transcriptional regulator [Undibacterium oligocarboniphilum]|uniref:XRE family transcriptional regulator n=1 Tax=Undibacterium oligocarboniphilum TaxID=666702 RepID=A0A850QBS5_9BURK|nr:XRE family transcriptional regulator [Undibacterium oligocarboniphilum]MBC3871140.1 XRE family transcriptional regulator [Undibacterium oligocarboniphilum]NVO76237.1 XRE family transcriptional regulator [Undibacterium oligocarboniphilum]